MNLIVLKFLDYNILIFQTKPNPNIIGENQINLLVQ